MIRDYLDEDFDAVRDLLRSEGWGGRADDPARLRRIIDAATRAVVAVDGDGVIGFGRSVSDGVSNGYISMLVVHPDHRRQRIGTGIVEELMGTDDRMTWVLRAGHPGSERFWTGIGFERSSIAFERPRRR